MPLKIRGLFIPVAMVAHANMPSPSYAEIRRHVLVYLGLRHGLFRHRSVHVGGLQPATLQFHHIDGVNSIDERAIPVVFGVKVGTETAIDKDIDDVPKPDKQVKM